MYDDAVLGGCVGGTLTGAMLAYGGGHTVILFKAMNYLGGCFGPFEREGYASNADVTTLVALSPALRWDFWQKHMECPFL